MQLTDGLIHLCALNRDSARNKKSFLSTMSNSGVRSTRAQCCSGPQKKPRHLKQGQAASAASDPAATRRLQTGGVEAHRPQLGPAPSHTPRRDPPVLRTRLIHLRDGQLALPPDATPQPAHASRPPPAYDTKLHEWCQMETRITRNSRPTPQAGRIRRAAAGRPGACAERKCRQCTLTAAVAAEA